MLLVPKSLYTVVMVSHTLPLPLWLHVSSVVGPCCLLLLLLLLLLMMMMMMMMMNLDYI